MADDAEDDVEWVDDDFDGDIFIYRGGRRAPQHVTHVRIDKSVDEDEAALVHHFGFRLGFSRGMINDFIDLMKHHQDSRVPSSGMLDIIRRYQN